MHKVVRIACILVLLGIRPSFATEQIPDYVPQAQISGEGRFTYMLWDLYDVKLIAPMGEWGQDKPFALTLSYLRRLSGKKIADKSTEEIRKQGFNDEIRLADWNAQMRRIFPDVDTGVILTGVYTENKETLFFKNDELIGTIADPEFGQYFFNIWLGAKTSAPDLRKKLLGGV